MKLWANEKGVREEIELQVEKEQKKGKLREDEKKLMKEMQI